MFAFLLVYYIFALWGGKRRKAEFTGRIDFRLEIMTGGTNGWEHGGLKLEEFVFPVHEAIAEQ